MPVIAGLVDRLAAAVTGRGETELSNPLVQVEIRKNFFGQQVQLGPESGKLVVMEDVSTEGFVRAGSQAGPVISRAALKLHTYAILVSIEVGRAGYICDDYLSAISVETSVAAFELTLAGLWTREADGYRVSEEETLRVAREVQRQLIALEQFGSDR